MDPIALLQESGEFFIERLSQVPGNAWGNDTPCPGWTVRAVASHVVNGFVMVPALLAGERPASADRPGDDPAGNARETLNAALVALRQPGALGQLVSAPAGQMPASAFALVRAADTVIHTWDLTAGAGIDTTLPPSLVAAVTAGSPPAFLEGARQAGVFGPALEVSPDADPQTTLLALYGRPRS